VRVRREGDVEGFAYFVVEELAEPVDDRAEAVLWVHLALGTPEVRGEDHLRLVAEGVLDGGERFADAGVVGDLAAVFGERHIEINADEEVLVLQIDVADG